MLPDRIGYWNTPWSGNAPKIAGTLEGAIAGCLKDRQVWLKPGDRLTSTIEKLGELQFTLA